MAAESKNQVHEIVGSEWRDYSVLDNGGTPFHVRYNKSTLQIFKMSDDDGVDIAEIMRNKPLQQFTIERTFVGMNNRNSAMNDRDSAEHRAASAGNSMLFLLTNGKYLYVGHTVYEFDTHEDEIVSYHSPIGNGDVPYPYAVGKSRSYLMLDHMMAENDAIAGASYKDPYAAYYGFDEKLGPAAAKKFFSKFPVKMIDKGFH
jgi:hypothetical protein